VCRGHAMAPARAGHLCARLLVVHRLGFFCKTHQLGKLGLEDVVWMSGWVEKSTRLYTLLGLCHDNARIHFRRGSPPVLDSRACYATTLFWHKILKITASLIIAWSCGSCCRVALNRQVLRFSDPQHAENCPTVAAERSKTKFGKTFSCYAASGGEVRHPSASRVQFPLWGVPHWWSTVAIH
jgi:hypothetical protein